MPAFESFPRCYTRRLCPQEGTVNRVNDGDQEFMALFLAYANRTLDSTTWSFRKRILGEVAPRLFGDSFAQWVEDQSRNANVAGYNLDFLKDTLEYIDSGKRRINPLQWLELVTELDEVATVHNGQMLGGLGKGYGSTQNTIQRWCRHPNGFEDMMLSMYIFFGTQRSPLEQEAPPHVPVGIAD